MNARRILGWSLLAFAALLVWSQTVAVFHFMDHQVEGFDFPKRYAIESSVQYYGFAVVVLVTGILVLRSSSRGVAYGALAVAFLALWLMVGRELWLHYIELPRKYPRFANARPPYFTGTLWMFTPRFLWHLILPVAAVLASQQVLGGILFHCACFGRAFRSVLSLRSSHVVFPSSRDLPERSVTRKMGQMTRNRRSKHPPTRVSRSGCSPRISRAGSLSR